MNARILRVRQLGAEEEAAWRQLGAQAVEPNPFFEPDCVVPAVEHQTFGDEIEVALAEEDGRLYAALPLRSVSCWRSFPYPFVTTKVRRMTYSSTPLVDSERAEEAMGAIFDALARRRGRRHGRVLVLSEMAEAGPVEKAAAAAAAARGLPFVRYESWERPYLRRRRESTYNEIHSKKDLKNMERLRRRLNAEVGAEVVLVDRSEDPAAVDEVIRLEAAGYKGQTGVALTDMPGEPEYFREMCDRFRKHGRLHVYTLEAKGVVCAVVLLLSSGDSLWMVKVDYDHGFARNSPGLQLHLDLIRHFHDQVRADGIDICTYEGNVTLLRMYPDRTRFTSFFVPLSSNRLDRLAIWSFIHLRRIHKWLYDRRQGRRGRQIP